MSKTDRLVRARMRSQEALTNCFEAMCTKCACGGSYKHCDNCPMQKTYDALCNIDDVTLRNIAESVNYR